MIQEETSKLSEKLQNGENIRLSFHYNTRVIDKFINSLFLKVLSRNDLNFLHGVIESILREMIINAVKANTKRVYFIRNNLNITDPEQYNDGMSDFKDFFTRESESLSDLLKESEYSVDVIVKKDEKSFKISVINNAELLPFERERINQRIEKSKNYNDFSDMYMDVSDEQEGEGLGISLMMLFLRNSGIGENSFRITSRDKTTRSSITVPLSTRPSETKEFIQKKISEDIDELPTFPENIVEVRNMCHDRNVSIEEIASKIEIDPSLVASVMRLVHSAGFITIRRTENITDAIKIIGLKNLNAILLAVAARKILDEKFSHFKNIWTHCNRVAFYARELAEKFGFIDDAEKFFLSGLLHDLGKIVLLSVHSELVEHIEQVIAKKQMRTSTILEEVTMGISHSIIGKLIAEKWNFPDYILEPIWRHHSPTETSDKNRDIVYITYLANCMCNIEEKKFHHFNLEEDVLERFGFENINDFKDCHREIKSKYEDRGKS